MVKLWWQFESETNSPIGRWLLQPDEGRMLETFLRREESEGGQIPSVFFELNVDFQKAERYPNALLEQLLDTCLELGNLEDLLSSGFNEQFFESYRGRPDSGAWLKFLKDFHQKMPEIAGHTVACLVPGKIADEEAYLRWLMQLLENGIPDEVRLMVVDGAEGPRYKQVAYYFPEKVHDLQPDLNMAAVMVEMAEQTQAQNPDDPGAQYQTAFVTLMQHSQNGDLPQVREYASKALLIARQQKWLHLQVAVYLALASAEVNQQAFDEAYTSYEKAISQARELEKEDESLGKRLAMQAYLGEGSARVADQDFEMAKNSYQKGATLALQLEDQLMAFEAWRMVGYCAEREKIWIEAWDAYHSGLKIAEALPDDQIKNTTLPYLGNSMVEIASKAGQSHQDKLKVLESLDRLLGPDWQDQPLTSSS